MGHLDKGLASMQTLHMTQKFVMNSIDIHVIPFLMTSMMIGAETIRVLRTSAMNPQSELMQMHRVPCRVIFCPCHTTDLPSNSLHYSRSRLCSYEPDPELVITPLPDSPTLTKVDTDAGK